MSTLRTPVKTRRARPTDVVNIYRLVSEELIQNRFVEPDEARALALVLGTIEQGYVAVAEHLGRIVGTIGFGLYNPGYSRERILDCEWFVVAPSYQQSGVGLALLRLALRAADTYNVVTRVSLCNVKDDERTTRWFTALGFKGPEVTWLRSKKNGNEEDVGQQDTDTNADEPEGSVVRGSGPVSDGSGDADNEPAVQRVRGGEGSGAVGE